MCSSIIFFISEHDMKLEGRCMRLFTISWPYIVKHDCVSEDWVCVLISVFNYVFYRQKVQCVVTGGWLCGYWLDFVSCCFTVAWVGIHWGSIHWLQAQKIPLRPVTNIGIPTPFEHSGMLIKTSWAGFSRMEKPVPGPSMNPQVCEWSFLTQPIPTYINPCGHWWFHRGETESLRQAHNFLNMRCR